MGERKLRAIALMLLFIAAGLSGCFGEDGSNGVIRSEDVVVTPEILIGGVFQGMTIAAERDVSVFVPYLIMNPENGFVQNSTVVDLRAGENVLLTVLAPPRTDTAVVLLGEYGRENWPIRDLEESWKSWLDRSGNTGNGGGSISRVAAINGTLDTVVDTELNGGGLPL